MNRSRIAACGIRADGIVARRQRGSFGGRPRLSRIFRLLKSHVSSTQCPELSNGILLVLPFNDGPASRHSIDFNRTTLRARSALPSTEQAAGAHGRRHGPRREPEESPGSPAIRPPSPDTLCCESGPCRQRRPGTRRPPGLRHPRPPPPLAAPGVGRLDHERCEPHGSPKPPRPRRPPRPCVHRVKPKLSGTTTGRRRWSETEIPTRVEDPC